MDFLTNLFGGIGKALSGGGSSLMSAFKSLPQALNPQISSPVWPSFPTGSRNTPGISGVGGGFNPFGGGGQGGGNQWNPFGRGGGGGGKPPPSAGFLNRIQQHQAFNRMGGGMTGGSSGGQTSWMDRIFPGGKEPGLAGLALTGLGELFSPKVSRAPDISSIPSFQAMSQFSAKPTGKLPLDLEESINRSMGFEEEEELRQLRNVYKNVRPGTDYTTDSSYQRDLEKLQRNQGSRRGDAIARAGFESMRYELGASEQEMAKLSELAQADLFTIMTNLSMDAEEASNFKEMFSNLATPLLSRASGLNQFQVA